MDIIIAFSISILIIAFWWWRTNKYDNVNPEPFLVRMKLFFYGAFISIFFALFMNFLIKKLGIPITAKENMTLYLFANAFFEEFGKFFALLFLIKKNHHADEPKDIFSYGFSVVLGFAFFENLIYILSNMDRAVQLAIIRGFFSTPGHLIFSSFFLLFLAKKWHNESKPILNSELLIKTLPFIMLSTLFHFSFNYLLGFKNILFLTAIVILLFVANNYFKKQYYAFFSGKLDTK